QPNLPPATDLWDRALHAQLVRKLTADGAKTIIFDFVFLNPADGDREFAEALQKHGKAVIAGALSPVESRGLAGFEPVFPVARLRHAAAGVGMIAILKDPDGAVRGHFLETEANPSLPRVAAQLSGAAAL